jgi:hypothetical protein
MLHLSNEWPRGWFGCRSHILGNHRSVLLNIRCGRRGTGVASVAREELEGPPGLLRHACSYALANKAHDTRAIRGWLGHRSITGTAVYTTPGAEPVQGFRATGEENRFTPQLTALASKPGAAGITRPIESDPAQTPKRPATSDKHNTTSAQPPAGPRGILAQTPLA